MVEFTQSLKVQPVWKQSVGSAAIFTFSPVVAGDSVFAAAADGTVTRINAANGTVAWRISAGTRLTAGAGSDGNTVAVAGRKALCWRLTARAKKSGRRKLPARSCRLRL
ncbi:PQQ-binding-like beta-propeller repeat protein [Collimonas fungivorans]|uniref:outer membrane protein assembly factor BamB family protein n=1 Tax=Collimonas fungivorans TaxID=158899 RepID=UPI000B031494